MKYVFYLFLSLLFALSGFCEDFSAITENFTISTNEKGEPTDYIIQGKRFRRDNAPVQILTHGIFNSYGIMEKLAKQLYDQGFDVWIYNQPGFGQQGNTSRINPLSKNKSSLRFGFKSLVEGMDIVLKHTLHSTTNPMGLKPSVGGFSLGGAVTQMYFSGVTDMDREGKFVIDPKLAVKRQKSVGHILFLAAPPLANLKSTSNAKVMINLASKLKGLLARVNSNLNFGFGQTGKTIPSVFASTAVKIVPATVYNLGLQGMGNLRNMDTEYKGNPAAYIKDSLSNVHSDILYDLSHYNDSLSAPFNHVQATYVVGNKDGMAHPNEVTKAYKNQLAANPSAQLIILEDVGHVDLLQNKILVEGGVVNDILDAMNYPHGALLYQPDHALCVKWYDALAH